jgi:hypothetical protein
MYSLLSAAHRRWSSFLMTNDNSIFRSIFRLSISASLLRRLSYQNHIDNDRERWVTNDAFTTQWESARWKYLQQAVSPNWSITAHLGRRRCWELW